MLQGSIAAARAAGAMADGKGIALRSAPYSPVDDAVA